MVSGTSVSSKTRCKTAIRFDKKLIVCDTPGICDTRIPEEEIRKEISRWYVYMSPGIHAILLVLKTDRISSEDIHTVEFFMEVFGDELKDFLIVVFANKDQLDDKNMSLEDYIDTIPSPSILQDLLDLCRERCIAIGYFKGSQVERETEVRHILSMIDQIKGPNDRFYSCEKFMRVQKFLREEEERMLMEEQTLHTRGTNEYTPSFNHLRHKLIKRVLNDEVLLARMQNILKGACLLAMCYLTGKFVGR